MKVYAFMLALLVSGIAQAALQVGTYTGTDNKRKSFEVHVQEYPGRRGSFLVVLKEKTVARLYFVDPFSKSKYGMLPLRPMDNYIIGIQSSTPVLALSEAVDAFTITPNSGPSDIAFDASITIKKNSKKELAIVEVVAGSYGSKKIQVSGIDISRESTVTSKFTGLEGDYVLRETRPNIYVMLKSQLEDTGIKLNKTVTNLVYFTKDRKMVVVNGQTGLAREIN